MSGRDLAMAVIGGMIGTYLVRATDRIGPRVLALSGAVAGSLLAMAAGLGAIDVALVAVALFLLAHLLVLAVSFAAVATGRRLPGEGTPRPTLPQRAFRQMAITAMALFVLPLEDLARLGRRLR